MFKRYLQLESNILALLLALLLLQLINASFMLIFMNFMDSLGYPDYESADIVAYRYFGVLFFSVPLGFYIRGRRLKPVFILGAILTPLVSFLSIYAAESYNMLLLYVSTFLLGIGFSLISIPVLPYILNNVKRNYQTEAIALNFSTWSIATILSGIGIFSFSYFFGFNDSLVLKCLIGISAIGTLIIVFISDNENIEDFKIKRIKLKAYDWHKLFKAMMPSFLIAIGAGLTIPFMSIFFLKIHNVSSGIFGFLGSFTSIAVAVAMLLVPLIKNKFGYTKSITVSQSLAIIALVFLATTQFYSNLKIAVFIAGFCYMLRQPLMNMAGPITSELCMRYVGSQNQEIMSALWSAIWSGSWFFSSQIFKILRKSGIDYVYVFLITAFFYSLGAFLYYLLSKEYEESKSDLNI